jgi:hypothetical protein
MRSEKPIYYHLFLRGSNNMMKSGLPLNIATVLGYMRTSSLGGAGKLVLANALAVNPPVVHSNVPNPG